jgi:5-methylcytosine-specific restriction protein A
MNCVHEWRLRNQPAYTKHCVEERDHGVCVKCGLDTVIQHQELKKLWSSINKGDHPEVAALSLKEKFSYFEIRFLKPTGIPPHRYNGRRLWDVDHVLEVANGGGSAGLDNLQTLCLKCHKEKTKKFLLERNKK